MSQSTPASVLAVQVTSLDGPSGLRVVELPGLGPEDAAGAVLVDVHAAGVSFPDLLMCHGRYQRKPPLPFVPGVEVAGVVAAAPTGSGFHPGDRVAAFVRVGGWAERVAVHPELTFPLPDDISFRSGAGMPMNYLTAHLALTRRGGLRPGETLVVHGAAGGLGTALLQAGRALGARVIGVVSTEEKAAFARAAGAHEAVLVGDWLAVVRDLVPGGVDVLADTVGGDRFLDSVRSLGKEGRLIVLGFAEGIPTVAANRLLLKNVDVRGVAWGSLIEDEPTYPRQQWSDVTDWHAAGHVNPVDGATYPLEQAADALRELEDRRATGKITLTLRKENAGPVAAEQNPNREAGTH
ncbi:NADPH:quinone oxidoreductase family protein [Nocardioides alcanivorans]|uniref:NADPH:quinone oxidoreductase family protein n=1 Tax=Nocardioides alcanivorans TaxID=2897352 RepID=UPI001F268AC8|nr:NADPH:quinone oxidoreductase family protein [Nocardioides alcanivorans]